MNKLRTIYLSFMFILAMNMTSVLSACLLYTSDAADDTASV